jgi:hypothetical protein
VAGQSELICISNTKTWNCSVQELIESLAAKTAANSRKHPYPANKTEQDLMRHLLLLGALMLPLGSTHAQAQKIKCPGDNTVEMRYCAGQSWEQSTDQLKQKLPRQMRRGRHDDYKGSALVLTYGQRPEFARSMWCWNWCWKWHWNPPPPMGSVVSSRVTTSL